jgi:hypothetical protein
MHSSPCTEDPRVVWDVDPVAGVVRCHRAGTATPVVFGAGSDADADADAEPVVPGWRLPIDWLMA